MRHLMAGPEDIEPRLSPVRIPDYAALAASVTTNRHLIQPAKKSNYLTAYTPWLTRPS